MVVIFIIAGGVIGLISGRKIGDVIIRRLENKKMKLIKENEELNLKLRSYEEFEKLLKSEENIKLG